MVSKSQTLIGGLKIKTHRKRGTGSKSRLHSIAASRWPSIASNYDIIF